MSRFAYMFICAVMAFAPNCVRAMTDEQKAKVHAHFEKLGMECFEVQPITEDDIMHLRAKKVPSGENVPCFMACMMKKMGVMDDKGLLHKDNALELASKVFEDPEEVNNISDFLHSCSGVNQAAVSDGEKGCERAFLAFKCMMENSSKFGFDM